MAWLYISFAVLALTLSVVFYIFRRGYNKVKPSPLKGNAVTDILIIIISTVMTIIIYSSKLYLYL